MAQAQLRGLKRGQPSGNDDCDSEDEETEGLPIPFQENMNTRQENQTCDMSVPAEWVSGVTSFCCIKSVVNAVNANQSSNHCVLGYKRTVQPQPEKNVRGRVNFVCIHGLDHERKQKRAPKIRKKQRVNNVGCTMQININQQKEGRWVLRAFIPDHVNPAGEPVHMTGEDVFKYSQKAKQVVDGQVMEQIKEFRAVRAPTAAIAERLSDKFGVNYTRKDITNRLNKHSKFKVVDEL